MSVLKKLLSSKAWLKFNIHLARAIGTNEAILLSFLIDKEDYWKEKGELKSWEQNGRTFEGFFFCLQEDIEKQTVLSPFQQSKALNILKENSLIEIIRKDTPPKNFFKLNEDQIETVLKDQETWSFKTKKLGRQSNNNTEPFTQSEESIKDSLSDSNESPPEKSPNRFQRLSPIPIQKSFDPAPEKRILPDFIKPGTGEYAVLQDWNSLLRPACVHEPNTKVAQQIVEYLGLMRNGVFGDLSRRKWDIDWLTKHKIDLKKFSEKKWTFREIRKTLRGAFANMYKDGFWPPDKKMLPCRLTDALYNPRTNRSFFIQAYYDPPGSIIQIKDPYPSITEDLTKAGILNLKEMKFGDQKQYYDGVRSLAKYLEEIDWRIRGARQMFGMGKEKSPYLLIMEYVKWMKCENEDLKAPSKIPERFHVGMIKPDFWMWRKFMEAVNLYWGRVFRSIEIEEG